MKRFWLFGAEYYYPKGGMSDFVDSFDSFADVMQYVSGSEFQWYEIYDSHEEEIVERDRDSAGF